MRDAPPRTVAVWNLTELRPRHRGPIPIGRWRPAHVWSEADLADAWEERRYAAPFLVDCCGRHLRVVFPGRRWGGPGPDFLGAVLAEADGTLVRGDVEIHLRASSWAAHRHAQDPAYRRVVLHVVQLADCLVLDAEGRHVPTVVLEPSPEPRPPRPLAVPCVRSAPTVLAIVEAAGRERFRGRVARFAGDLAVASADQVLWRGVCEALGYRRNTAAFGQLAEAVPWAWAAQVVVDRGPVGLAGLLLGTAGLLAEATLPEAHAWRALQRTFGARPALAAEVWDRRQLRAGNAPSGRCRGLAEVAWRWVQACRDGPPRCRFGGPAEAVLAEIGAAARLRRPRLWRLVHASPWIGRGRAQVVVVNVLLPLAAAAGVAQAETLFERLPGEPSNRVVRYMAQQLGGRDGVRFRGACHQQGLLHLFKQTCAARVCEHCPARASGGEKLPGATTSLEDASYD